jgi:hypothetical protein
MEHGGGSKEKLERALANVQPLSSYEMELLETAHVEIDGNERFFRLAKAVLGPNTFVGLLGEAKGDELEGRRPKKTPTARLIFRIMRAASAGRS